MASKPQTPNPSSGSPNSTGRRKPIRRVSPPEEERNPENSLPRDDNEESAIASVIEEFGEVIMEDPLEILEYPAIRPRPAYRCPCRQSYPQTWQMSDYTDSKRPDSG